MRELEPAWPPEIWRSSDDRVEALRGGVHGRREPGGPGADDRDVVDVGAEPRAAADGLDQVAVGRVDQHATVVAHDGRQPRTRPARLARAARRPPSESVGWNANGMLKRVRRSRISWARALFSGAAIRNSVKPRRLGARPAREKLAHGRIQPVIGEPRLDEVVVDLAERHRGHDRVRRRVVALDEQDPLRQRVQRVRAGEEVDARHLRHPLVGDQQGDGLAVVGERLELARGRPRARRRRRCGCRCRSGGRGRPRARRAPSRRRKPER